MTTWNVDMKWSRRHQVGLKTSFGDSESDHIFDDSRP